MKKRLLLSLAFVFLGRHAYADLSGGGLTDYYGNGVSSQSFFGTRNSLDVETVVGGTVIDPRSRTWTLGVTDTPFVSQGAPNSVPSAWPIKLTDGTNTMGVAPASTPSTSAQPAGVVALSPNSPLPSGQTGSIGQVTANAGTNLNTSALQLQSGANLMLDRSGTANMTAACTTPASCPANSTVTALSTGSSTVNFTLTNTWVGTVVFEGLDGNSTWQSTIGTVPGNGSPTSSSGTPINLSIPSGGFSQVRARCTVFVSGTITASYNVGAGLSTLQVFNLTPSAFMATVTGSGSAGTPSTGVVSIQGVSGGTVVSSNVSQIGGSSLVTGTGTSGSGVQRVTVSNDSKVIAWDGTNTSTVKAGSTQAVLTDTAVVVTGRPDNVGTPTQTSVSCAATSTTLLAASTASLFLSIRNPTTSLVTIWINTAGVAAVVAAPSLDIPPGGEAFFSAEGASFLPTSQINCISSGAASSVTITYK